MGFGSYDETEQGHREFDAGDVDDEAVEERTDHEGDVRFEFGESNDELLDRLEDIKGT